MVMSGYYHKDYDPPPGSAQSNIQGAHIIPFSMGKYQPNVASSKRRYETIWAIFQRYFPVIAPMRFTSDQLNTEKNMLSLDGHLHTAFSAFRLALMPTDDTPNRYNVLTFDDSRLGPYTDILPKVITLTAAVPGIEMPNAELLRIHASVAKFLHMKGHRESPEKILQDYANCGVLASNGSTDVERLLNVTGLTLASSNNKSDYRKPGEKHFSSRQQEYVTATAKGDENKE
ncbi:hypothetical protein N7456_007850 [Penicillium angulare]|uniref:HNH nuclease domain-containing protein n=1 Tax=Penicillium angulare TaxID=116970 RepID=A0A9W9FBR4_9EURO|nr:hypothetical protein N7456_007850 [Penicillium angulare]